MARREGRARGLRLSRQVLLRALRIGLEAELGTDEVRRRWATTALRVATALEADNDAAALVAQRDPDRHDGFDNSVLILLLRIAEGRVAALSSGFVPDPITDQVIDTDRAVERAARYATGLGGALTTGTDVDELRVLQVRDLGERWRNWKSSRAAGLSPPSPAGTPSARPTTMP